jgi:hypothetical protein
VSTLTPKVGLKRPDGTDPFLRTDFVNNWNLIDQIPGAYICDSTTLPVWGSAQAGRLVFLTDYKQIRYWDGAAWQDERTAVPLFAGGAIFDTTVGKNATPTFNIVTFTTPRPCTMAVILNATVSCDSQHSQDVYLRVNFDNSDLLLGGYSDAMRFTGNSSDTSADMKMTCTAIAVVNATKGTHSIKGKLNVGTYNTSVILRGMKAIGMIGLYASSNSL